jgi:hypothetical protein
VPFFVEEGQLAWQYLVQTIGFDAEGTFRRHKLIPWTFVPQHVSNRHDHPGDPSARASLFRHLHEAHTAFMFGAPYAAIAMCRSILELVLREHYGAEGDDLNDMIKCATRYLPHRVNPLILHKLRIRANEVLHYKAEELRHSNINIETEFRAFLLALRSLIEGVPNRHGGPIRRSPR